MKDEDFFNLTPEQIFNLSKEQFNNLKPHQKMYVFFQHSKLNALIWQIEIAKRIENQIKTKNQEK